MHINFTRVYSCGKQMQSRRITSNSVAYIYSMNAGYFNQVQQNLLAVDKCLQVKVSLPFLEVLTIHLFTVSSRVSNLGKGSLVQTVSEKRN